MLYSKRNDLLKSVNMPILISVQDSFSFKNTVSINKIVFIMH